MFTKRVVLKTPDELELGDIILGARVNYVKHINDESNWTLWEKRSIKYLCEKGCVYHPDICRGALQRSHHVCEFLVERLINDGEVYMKYVRGQGWVYE